MTREPQGLGKRPISENWILLGTGVAALAPLALYHGLFARLFWFGDEFDLIDQIDRTGFWHWVFVVFAENFVPVFKVLWGGSVLVFHGSYFAMIVLLWLTHGLVVALLGKVMRRCGLSWAAVALAQILLGLAPANAETLCWSVQWSAVLSVAFMLLALDAFLARPFGPGSFAWVGASALSFSRGVMSGVLLAAAGLWPGQGAGAKGARRAALCAGYLAIAVAVAAVITLFSSGNHRHMAGHWGEAAVYGIWYYCLNPAQRMLGVESWGWHTVALLGALKCALVAWALLRSGGRTRMLFALLVASDLGNALLLGIGRYHTGIETAVSSRYEYASLIGIAPLLGYWAAGMLGKVRLPAALRASAAAAALAVLAVAFCRQWRSEIGFYSEWRGSEPRRILLVEPHPGDHAVPGIPFMETDRAKAIIRKYGLK